MGTCRTESQLETLFHDNSIGDISAGDGRDLIQSDFGFKNNRDPNAGDDRVNSNGTGQFFDTGSRWHNVVSGRWFKCMLGAPHAAVWQAVAFDGETMGGRLQGSFPNPTLLPSGVVPGVYGDATHFTVFAVNADGTLAAAGTFPVGGGGSVLRPVKQLPANYATVPGDLGFLLRPNTSGITITCSTGVGFGQGWVAFFETVVQNSAIHFQAASPKFHGGGYGWANAAFPFTALTSFDLLGAYHFSLVSDGTDLHVCGLPVCADPIFGNAAPFSIPDDAAFHNVQLSPDPDGQLGMFGPNLCLAYQPVIPSVNLQAPMIGFYEVDFQVNLDYTFSNPSPVFVGILQATVTMAGQGYGDQRTIVQPGTHAGGSVTLHIKNRCYCNIGDTFNVSLLVQGQSGFPMVVTASFARVFVRYLGT